MDDQATATIQRSDPLPYYAQLANILRDEIERGRWSPGEMLPSESDLGEFFNLSRTAVRQALGELQAQGLVRKEKGRGTFVTRRRIAEFVVQELRGFHEEMTQKGRRVDTRIIDLSTDEVPPEVAEHLDVPIGSEVVRLERVRSIDGEAVVHVETYLPASRFASLSSMELGGRSLYAVLDAEFGVRPHGGVRSIEAEGAAPDVAKHLGLRRGAPVLKLDAINLDRDGTPFEFFRARYRGDQTTFQIWLEARA